MKQELTLKEMKEFKPSEEQIKATEQVFFIYGGSGHN